MRKFISEDFLIFIYCCRPNGEGELYTYLPLTQQNANAQLAVPPQTIENQTMDFQSAEVLLTSLLDSGTQLQKGLF